VTFNYHVRLLNPEVLNLHERLILLRDGMLWPEPSPGRSLRERPRVLAHKGAKAEPLLSVEGYLASHNATALNDFRGRSLYIGKSSEQGTPPTVRKKSPMNFGW